jgi:hypothetical protein
LNADVIRLLNTFAMIRSSRMISICMIADVC